LENSVREPSPILKPGQLGLPETNAIELRESLENSDLRLAILEALSKDSVTAVYLNSPPDGFSVEEGPGGILLKGGRVYVPEDNGVKLRIVEECHDRKMAGHLGQEKTLELVERDYVWPGMRKFVNNYVLTCDTCARNKTPRHCWHAQLQPLPIPGDPWQSVTMDYIVELAPSHGYNAIYVCVDRLTKMAHFVAMNSNVTAEETADLYLRNVFKNHSLPQDIVSDRGTQFVSKFTKRLLELLGVKGNRSTTYHPESDEQTEMVNQTLEQFLRVYCDYHQDDWYQLFPLAEFVYNNAKSSSTGMSPFFANYGRHHRAAPKVRTEAASYEHPAVEALADRLKDVHAELRSELQKAQQAYERKFDRKAKPMPPFKVGDLVWLNRKNIETVRPSVKLDFKRFSLFKITKVVGEGKLAFELELPPQWRIHNVFHATLLDSYHANEIDERTQLVPQLPEIVEGEPEYEVKEVLDSKVVGKTVWYNVDWVRYGPEERTWEPAGNLNHAEKLVATYHRRHSNRPSPADIPNQPRRSSARKEGCTVMNVVPPGANQRGQVPVQRSKRI
jgi:Integrase zinc binding domain/Chromo (CHRromatin Organisation MOdifier) domain/Integrase core domain